MFNKMVNRHFLNTVVYIGSAISLLLLVLTPAIGYKLFYLTTYFALLALFINKTDLTIQKKQLVAPISLFLFGVSHLVWISIYKQPDSTFLPLYRSYHEAGKALIAGSVLLLFSLYHAPTQKEQKYLTYIILMLCGVTLCYSLYQSLVLHYPRIELSFQLATSAAYIISAIGLLGSYALLQQSKRYAVFYYTLFFVLIYAVIILTGTRATIISFPLLNILLFLLISGRKQLKAFFVGITAVILVSTMLFHTQLLNRAQDFFQDINRYQQADSHSSIGARFAMLQVGLYAAKQKLLGQTADQREQLIKQKIAQQGDLAGSYPYLNTHLHNELIDNLSLKGIAGGILLFIVYTSLFYTAISNRKNPVLIVLVISAILYGLSDLIFYAKNTTMVYLLAFSLCVLLQPVFQEKRRKESA